MANPLFYNDVMALNSEEHRNLRLRAASQGYSFAGGANLLPALIEEFPLVVGHMPVAFLPGTNYPTAVFVSGVVPGQNLFVSSSGDWSGNYAPAYLRRYPFIMGDMPGSDPVLCVDASFSGFNNEDGERLFSESGEVTATLRQALQFSEAYRLSAKTTEEFCAKLHELGLFRVVTLDAKIDGQKSAVVHGLLIVDEDALNALEPDVLAGLAKAGFLKPIYAHLLSLANLTQLTERAQAKENNIAA